MWVDRRVTERPGGRYYEWERKGVPLRIEVGQNEVKTQQVAIKTRTEKEKAFLPVDRLLNSSGCDGWARSGQATSDQGYLHTVLHDMHISMLDHANKFKESRISHLNTMDEIIATEARVKTGSSSQHWYAVPWHENDDHHRAKEQEKKLKNATKLTIRCFPQGDMQKMKSGKKCIVTGQEANRYALVGRAF